MNRHHAILAASGTILIAAFLFGTCKSNSTSPGNGNNNGGGGGGASQITATVDGKLINFSTAFHSGTYVPTTPFGPVLEFAIEATANSPLGADISLSGGGSISTGTFGIGSDQNPNCSFSLSYAYDTVINGDTGNYHYSSEGLDGASCGTITISSVSSSGVSGTFQAHLPAGVARDTAPAAITGGTFYINFNDN